MEKREFIKLSMAAGLVAAVAPMSVLAGESGHIPEFTLPKLPFAYTDYEPAIDALTMEIHHSKHHQGYVNNLNAALKQEHIHFSSLEDLISRPNLSTAIRNNGGGHWNHSLFWETLKPKGEKPSAAFEKLIATHFTSFDGCLTQLNEAATKRFGSGWAWICQDKQTKGLFITSTPNQDNPLMQVAEKQGVPIFGIDVWEHAYYLKYQNKRADYLKAVNSIIDWKTVESKLIS